MFSKYSVSFNSRYSLNEAYKLIEELSSNKLAIAGYRFSIETASLEKDAAKATLSSRLSSLLHRNSFTPLINISIAKSEKGTSFLVEFEISSGVKLFIILFDLACLFFQILLLGGWLGNEGFQFHYLMPICMMILVHIFIPIACHSTLTELKSKLYVYFTGNDAESAPELIKCITNASD